jgi:(4-O-methyl)-D-glucuronate---lignin esterase
MTILRRCAVRWSVFLVVSQIAHPQQSRETIPVNYDESAVGKYVLPDALELSDGQRVRDADSWWKKRRPEIFRLFETNVYGRSPDRPAGESFEVFDLDGAALDGKAVRKQVTVYFSKNKDGPREDVLIYLPAGAHKPAPLILSLNFSGNQSIIADPAVRLPVLWDRAKTKRDASPESRGKSKDFTGAVENALARGYGFASIYYGQIEPDFREGLPWGVRCLFLKPGQTEPAADEWGAIAAWGWGLSRAMDYLETDRDIDSKRVAILGHSRLGKTVLWAGARDTRFAMVIANCSGEGGASLARRNYGETVKHMNANFPYQFATNFQKFGEHVDQLPVDTHELISLIAPRFLYLGTAEEDRWADPRGEFLAAVAAGPVYRLLGKKGLETIEMPALNTPIMHDIGYHYRNGKHEITAFDWEQFFSFADLHWK